MSTLPRIEDLRTSTDPVVLNNGNHEIVRFVYEKSGDRQDASSTVDIVFRHKKTHERVHYRFHGVVIKYLPPIQSYYPLIVTNVGLRQHEVPRPLAVSVVEEHPDTGVVFHAASVERIA